MIVFIHSSFFSQRKEKFWGMLVSSLDSRSALTEMAKLMEWVSVWACQQAFVFTNVCHLFNFVPMPKYMPLNINKLQIRHSICLVFYFLLFPPLPHLSHFPINWWWGDEEAIVWFIRIYYMHQISQLLSLIRFLSTQSFLPYLSYSFVSESKRGLRCVKLLYNPNNEIIRRSDDREDWKAMFPDVCNTPGTWWRWPIVNTTTR